ncbi:hypothetical protein ACRALDRAFT_208906 [Sodiomyces alcalophilus JCM 7366]|uniref:uncharacterized protein n=1 Tax=Sodiomyces alcalophilus JCM 7366 TaxID=591952 RepID=UPI0039B5B592
MAICDAVHMLYEVCVVRYLRSTSYLKGVVLGPTHRPYFRPACLKSFSAQQTRGFQAKASKYIIHINGTLYVPLITTA